MFSGAVVVDVDEIGDFSSGVRKGLKTSILEHFIFQSSHEGFSPSVVVRVSPCRHALLYSVTLKNASICPTTVLTSSIAVKDECCVDRSGFQSIVERLADQITVMLKMSGLNS